MIIIEAELLNLISESFYFYADLDFNKGQSYLPLIKTAREYIYNGCKNVETLEKNKYALSQLGGAYAYYKYCLVNYEKKIQLGHIRVDDDKTQVETAKEILLMEKKLNSRFLNDDEFIFKSV